MKKDGAVGMQINCVSNLIRRSIDLRIAGMPGEKLSRMDSWIIHYMLDHQQEDVFQKDVEAEFAITRATASKMLSNMEQRGLIQRSGVEGDARLKRLCLTEKSLQKFHLMQGSAQRFEQRVTYGMTEEERQELLRLLRIIERNMETDDPRPSAETERR